MTKTYEVPEVWYEWKEYDSSGGYPQLVTPRADPMVYEYAIDFAFDTPEDARVFLEEVIDQEESAEWVLVKMTMALVERGE